MENFTTTLSSSLLSIFDDECGEITFGHLEAVRSDKLTGDSMNAEPKVRAGIAQSVLHNENLPD